MKTVLAGRSAAVCHPVGIGADSRDAFALPRAEAILWAERDRLTRADDPRQVSTRPEVRWRPSLMMVCWPPWACRHSKAPTRSRIGSALSRSSRGSVLNYNSHMETIVSTPNIKVNAVANAAPPR